VSQSKRAKVAVNRNGWRATEGWRKREYCKTDTKAKARGVEKKKRGGRNLDCATGHNKKIQRGKENRGGGGGGDQGGLNYKLGKGKKVLRKTRGVHPPQLHAKGGR